MIAIARTVRGLRRGGCPAGAMIARHPVGGGTAGARTTGVAVVAWSSARSGSARKQDDAEPDMEKGERELSLFCA